MQRKRNDPRLSTLEGRLNYLFESFRPPGKPRYTVREVSEAIKRDQGFDISAAYINQLCNGKRKNPGVQQVHALEAFFGVPEGFLIGVGNLRGIADQIEQLREAIAAKEKLDREADDALRDPFVELVAVKARGLSELHLPLVSAVLDHVRRLEGLDQQEDASPESASTPRRAESLDTPKHRPDES